MAASLRDSMRSITGDKSLFTDDVYDALFEYLVPDPEGLQKRLNELEKQRA